MLKSKKLIVTVPIFLWVPLFAFAQDLVPEFRDQVVVVQFAPDVIDANGKTSQAGVNHLFSRFDVHSLEPVYPILDHVEPTPKTRHNLLSLRRTDYVHYGVHDDPLDIS